MFKVAFLVCLLAGALSASAAVSIQGTNFFRDGKPWIVKGINVEAFNRPAAIAGAPKWLNDSAVQARSWWGAAELDAIKNRFKADTIRFNVSQPALDPQSPIYDEKYRDELLSVFKQVRQAGLVVVVAMDAAEENGIKGLPCMPNDSTVRAWKTLAPTLLHDQDVMLELFNEPCRANWTDGRTDWTKGMQLIINTLRGMGAENVFLLDGLGLAQWVNDLFPLVQDTVPNKMALAVHPYLDQMSKEPQTPAEEYVNKRFGLSVGRYPMIATEWNATPTNGCIDAGTPVKALNFIRYLQSHHIGLIGWAIDSRFGPLVKDHTAYEPTDYADFKSCKDGTPSGAGSLVANYPNN